MSLARDLLERFDGPLVWGVNDCVHFAAAAVEYYGGWRPNVPQYSSEREALRLIANAGSLAALVSRAMPPPIALRDTQLGDVVLARFGDGGEILGVADPRCFWLRGENGGFAPVDLELAILVWPCRR